MAEKEFTILINDLLPSMALVEFPRTVSGLAHGLDFPNDLLASKLIRGKKTDLVAAVGVHTTITHNALATLDQNTHMALLQPFMPVTYDSMRALLASEFVRPNPVPIADTEANLLKALVYAVHLFMDATPKAIRDKPDRNAQVKRTVVVTSDLLAALTPTEELTQGVGHLMAQFNIQLIVNYVAINSDESSLAVSKWRALINEWNTANHFDTVLGNAGLLYPTEELLAQTQAHPPGRYYKPTRLWQGDLRMGIDPLRTTGPGSLAGGPALAAGCEDLAAVRFPVEIYPALRAEKIISGTPLVLTPNGAAPVTTTRTFHYEQDGAPVAVDVGEGVKGFRYTATDLVPTLQELEKTLRLPTAPAFDLQGFVSRAALPPWYFSAPEANYVVPAATSSFRDTMAFVAFVKALILLGLNGVARWVLKPLAEVAMVVLVPVVLQAPPVLPAAKREAWHPDRYETFALVAHRLPFSEDERLASFPALTHTPGGPRSKETFPSAAMVEAMEAYIDSMDLGGGEAKARIAPNHNKKALPIPVEVSVGVRGIDGVLQSVRPVSYAVATQNALFKAVVLKAAAANADPPQPLDPEALGAPVDNLARLLHTRPQPTQHALISQLVEMFGMAVRKTEDAKALVDTQLVNGDTINAVDGLGEPKS